MTGPGTSGVTMPVDVLAILTDLQQQLADLTGIVAAQQRTLHDLNVIVQSQSQSQSQSQAHAPQQPTSGTAPSAALPSALPSAVDVPVGA